MAGFASHTIQASDGLRLHVRDYGRAEPDAPTVLCLPGLARTCADFDPLARHLIAADPARRVLALDYRGRGLSATRSQPRQLRSADRIRRHPGRRRLPRRQRGVLVGTSRGGLHTMILAAVRPTLLRGAVINDIGPVIEAVGLSRIRGYVGKLPQPASWDDAVAALKAIAATQFTGLSDADWLTYAQTTFEQEAGAFRPRYDPALMRNLAKLDLDAIPTLWPQFDALKGVPVVVRGENSDLLSAATVATMVARHPDCTAVIVPGQGHAPLLSDNPTMDAIAAFVARCEMTARSQLRMESGLALLT